MWGRRRSHVTRINGVIVRQNAKVQEAWKTNKVMGMDAHWWMAQPAAGQFAEAVRSSGIDPDYKKRASDYPKIRLKKKRLTKKKKTS